MAMTDIKGHECHCLCDICSKNIVDELRTRNAELERQLAACKEDLADMFNVGPVCLECQRLSAHLDEVLAELARLVVAAEKSQQTFIKMIHLFAGNLDYPKEYRKHIEQLSSELKAAIDAVKGGDSR